MFVWHKSRYVGFSMYIIKADLQVELICLSGEGRLSNQTSIFLAYFDVFIWHLVVGSKRVWLVDCSWGRLWLVSQRNSLPNFALRILQFCARRLALLAKLFFASLQGACLQAAGLYVSADRKRERATSRAWGLLPPPFLSQTPLVAARYFYRSHWSRPWPIQLNTLHSPCFNTSYLFSSLSVVNVNPNTIRPCWVEMLHKLVWPVLL